jgi:outer membrane protein OmpA-like peptidoglycan-associated protein
MMKKGFTTVISKRCQSSTLQEGDRTGGTAIFIILLSLFTCPAFNQHQTMFDPYVASSLFNPTCGKQRDENSIYVSRHLGKIAPAQQRVAYLMGCDVHLLMKKSPGTSSTITLHYMDESLQTWNSIRGQFIHAGYAHHLRMARKSTLSAALQAAYEAKNINLEGFTTGSQYMRHDGFLPERSLNEPYQHVQSSFFTLGSAISYAHVLNSNQTLRAGASVFNLHHKQLPTCTHPEKQPLHYMLHAGYNLTLGDGRWSVHPKLSFSSHYATQWRVVSGIMYHMASAGNGFDAVSLWMMATAKQSTSVGLKIHHPYLIVGMNYTFYAPGVPLQGATEIVLAYRFGNRGKEKIADKPSPLASPRRFYAFEERTSEPIPVEKEKQPEVNYQLSRYVDFEFNSDTLSGEARQYLDELVVLLRSDESLKVEVTGHTDHVGTRKVNEKLSLQRARAVADYLFEHGISARRVNILGFGSKAPLNNNSTEDQQARNRRVDIRIYR